MGGVTARRSIPSDWSPQEASQHLNAASPRRPVIVAAVPSHWGHPNNARGAVERSTR